MNDILRWHVKVSRLLNNGWQLYVKLLPKRDNNLRRIRINKICMNGTIFTKRIGNTIYYKLSYKVVSKKHKITYHISKKFKSLAEITMFWYEQEKRNHKNLLLYRKSAYELRRGK